MSSHPTPAGPIDALEALVATDRHLLTLLDGIGVSDWDRATIVPGWRVRHVAGHLLDTALRRLSVVRDGIAFDGPSSGDAADVATFVNRANAEGVRVFGRLSPQVLRGLTAPAVTALHSLLASRDMYAPAAFPVSWAGESRSAHWFDVARELTERWHHQQQIRLALGQPGLLTRALYHPVLDCFMRALPWTYRDVVAPAGCCLAVHVTGEAGGTWYLVRDHGAWLLTIDATLPVAATVTLDGAIAWRVFTRGITAEEALRTCRIEGDAALGRHVLSALAIVG